MKFFSTIVLLIAVHLCSGQSYTFVFLHKKVQTDSISKDALAKLMEGHLANMGRLAQEKKLLAAGPFDGGGGIFILNTTSEKEAKEWLSTDPGIQAKRWDVEILPYTPIVGSVCPVTEPYEMTSYHFIRLSLKEKSKGKKIQNAYQLTVKKFLEGKDLVTHGKFGTGDEIVIIRNSEDSKTLDDTIVKADEKTLWIAKGSFCEP